MRLTSLVFSLALVAQTLCACGDGRYRLGSGHGQGDQPGGADTDSRPMTIIDVEDSTPLVRDGIERIVSEDLLGVIFVVADEEHIYFNTLAGPIWRARHDGTNRVQLADDTVAHHLVADENHVYWSRFTEIIRVPKAGGETEIVAVLSPQLESLAMSLALGDTFVYASTQESKTIERAPKTGGSAQVLAQTNGTTGGVAIDGSMLYWADYTALPEGRVHRRDLLTGETSTFFGSGGAMLLAAGEALWLTHPGTPFSLARVPFDGGPATAYRSDSYSPLFAGDDTHVYWFRNGLLGRVNRETRRDETVAEVPGDALGIAVSKQWVFVADEAIPGGILRIPKPPP
jgi:hypothetical protein